MNKQKRKIHRYQRTYRWLPEGKGIGGGEKSKDIRKYKLVVTK